MLTIIWLGLIIGSAIIGVFNGTLDAVVLAVTDNAINAVNLALKLTAVMMFWLGIMRLAEKAGIVVMIARMLRPLLKYLFPNVPEEHPAMGSIVMNMTANMMGLVNAATPFGLRAMEELQQLNKYKQQASDAMCMFLAINTSSVQLIPATAIAFLAAAGSANPTVIVFSGLLATTCSTFVAIICAKWLASWRFFKIRRAESLTVDTGADG